MDELKNLVIQTLETNGILGQLRAQLRSCVFKVIDNQDQIEKGQSGFHWENPNARKVLQTATGVLCAELVKDFLEFYKLDYTLAIYMPEVNLNAQNAMSKEELSKKIGLQEMNPMRPLMAQLIESCLSGDKPAPSQSMYKEPVKKEEDKSSSFMSREQPPAAAKKSQEQSSADVSKSSVKSQQQQPAAQKKDEHERHLERASQMLEEQKLEERSGFNLGGNQYSSSQIPADNKQKQQQNKREDDIIDTYGDDFEDDDIEEDLPDTDQLLESNDHNNQHKHITESAGITVSQSLGVDPSVDSLALEDYDHIEPVERIS